jgi:hypothetical protein
MDPVVYFITTGNTTVPPETITQGITWGVEVWQQQVIYDANDDNHINPMLQLGPPKCLMPPLCTASPSRPPLPPVPVMGDPDPATIDG